MLYFAAVRQALGKGEEKRALPQDVRTVRELIAHLANLGPAYASVFGDPTHLKTAVNQTYASLDTSVVENDEVAFFPPVTGG
nr:molybdopterin converting factor subunit 1 [Rhizomicrobium palustre]